MPSATLLRSLCRGLPRPKAEWTCHLYMVGFDVMVQGGLRAELLRFEVGGSDLVAQRNLPPTAATAHRSLESINHPQPQPQLPSTYYLASLTYISSPYILAPPQLRLKLKPIITTTTTLPSSQPAHQPTTNQPPNAPPQTNPHNPNQRRRNRLHRAPSAATGITAVRKQPRRYPFCCSFRRERGRYRSQR